MSNNKKMLWIYAFGLTLLPIVVSFIFDGIHTIGLKIGINIISYEQGLMFTNFSVYLILMLSVGRLLGKEIKRDWEQMKRKWFSSLIKYGIPCWIIGIITNNILSFLRVSTSGNQEQAESMYSVSWILSIITFCILGPIVEEIVFRYIIMGHFNKGGACKGIFISSILFGILHLSELSILVFMNYFIGGLYFAFVYYKTKNITACILVHIFNNAISILISFLLVLVS